MPLSPVHQSQSIIDEATNPGSWYNRYDKLDTCRALAASYGETAARSLDSPSLFYLARKAATFALEVVGRKRGAQEFI